MFFFVGVVWGGGGDGGVGGGGGGRGVIRGGGGGVGWGGSLAGWRKGNKVVMFLGSFETCPKYDFTMICLLSTWP